MPPDTQFVFLDVQPLRAQDLDFSSPSLARLARLIADGELKLVLTYVTEREVRSQIDKHSKEAFRHAKDLKKVSRIVRDLLPAESLKRLNDTDEETIRTGMQDEFTRFLMETKAEIVPIDKVSPRAVFEKFFKAEPPFSETGNKKSEFPDAFAAAALQAWCEAVPGRKLYVISGDKDWRLVCSDVPAFIHVGRLEKLLEYFADAEIVAAIKDAVRALESELIRRINEIIEGGNIYFYVDDSAIDGEVNDVEDVHIGIVDVHVISASDGVAAVAVAFDLKATLDISADDPDSMYRDDDDGTMRSVWTVRGSVEREFEIDVAVDIRYEVQNPKAIEITGISVPEDGLCVSVEDNELTPQYDDDDDDEPEIYGPDEDQDDGEF